MAHLLAYHRHLLFAAVSMGLHTIRFGMADHAKRCRDVGRWIVSINECHTLHVPQLAQNRGLRVLLGSAWWLGVNYP
jgi:hypothetical protein